MNEDTTINSTYQEQSSQLQSAKLSHKLLLIVIATAVIAIDQISKWMVEQNLPLYHVWAPVPELENFFRVFHVSNTGAAFGLFPAGSGLFTIAAVLVSIGILYYNFTLDEKQLWLRVALGLQLGGALGNLIDRMRLGHVTDFLDFGPWAIFNLADLAVVTGAVILGVVVWQEQRELARQEAQPTMSTLDTNE